jgi:hypothetical protein
MKKILLISFFILFCTTAYADKYAYKNPNGTVRIADYQGGKDSLEQFLVSVGIDPKKVIEVDDSKLPKEDQKYWTIIGKRVVVDEEAKQTDLDLKALKKADESKVLEKLNLNSDEAKTLKQLLRDL